MVGTVPSPGMVWWYHRNERIGALRDGMAPWYGTIPYQWTCAMLPWYIFLVYIVISLDLVVTL